MTQYEALYFKAKQILLEYECLKIEEYGYQNKAKHYSYFITGATFKSVFFKLKCA